MQIYVGEMFPNRIRESGVAIGVATQWLFNFVFSYATPYAVANLGWKTFLMFAVFNFALVVYVWFFILETKGRSLEEMESRKLFPWEAERGHCANLEGPVFAQHFRRFLPASDPVVARQEQGKPHDRQSSDNKVD